MQIDEERAKQRVSSEVERRVILLYMNTRAPLREIAANAGCSRSTVYAILERYGLRSAKRSTPNE